MSDRPNSYDYEALLACARGELFGPGNAQLPAPPMLMAHRVTSITADGGPKGKGQVVAEFDVDPDLWFFQCHFLGDPVGHQHRGRWQLGVDGSGASHQLPANYRLDFLRLASARSF